MEVLTCGQIIPSILKVKKYCAVKGNYNILTADNIIKHGGFSLGVVAAIVVLAVFYKICHDHLRAQHSVDPSSK